MDLTKLFETQAALDARIYESHPELKGQDNLDWKVLALQVELGECANEWRGFKKWSHDQEPRTELFTWVNGLGECKESKYNPKMLVENGQFNAFRIKNPLLEEYVDCLHFILSIGLELKQPLPPGIMQSLHFTPYNESITTLFIEVNSYLLNFYGDSTKIRYARTLQSLLGLGATLGFTWEQVEAAYYAKNEINHQRQESGY